MSIIPDPRGFLSVCSFVCWCFIYQGDLLDVSSGLFTGHDATGRSGQEVFQISRVGSGQVAKIGPGRVESGGFTSHGTGWVGSPWPDPTREKRPDP